MRTFLFPDKESMLRTTFIIGEEDNIGTMKQAMELKLQPLIIPNLLSTNVKLHFLSDGLSYDPQERPSMISMFKIFRLCLNEGKNY